MAWPSIGWTTGIRTDDWAEGLEALVKAIDERRDATGRSVLSWIYDDNKNTKQNPTKTDFAALTLNGDALRDLFLDIQDEIKDLCDNISDKVRYTTAAQDGSAYTSTSLATAVGLGAWPAQPDHWKLDDWRRMKEGLDKLIYILGTNITIDSLSRNWVYAEDAGNVTKAGAMEDAWDDMSSQAAATSSSSLMLWKLDFHSGGGGTFDGEAWRYTDITVTFDASAYSATWSQCHYFLQGNFDDYTDHEMTTDFTFEVDGEERTIDADSPEDQHEFSVTGKGDWEEVFIEDTSTITYPFEEPGGDTDQGQLTITAYTPGNSFIALQGTLTGLTDQA